MSSFVHRLVRSARAFAAAPLLATTPLPARIAFALPPAGVLSSGVPSSEVPSSDGRPPRSLSAAAGTRVVAADPHPTRASLDDTADVHAFVTRFFAALPPALRVPRAAVVLVRGDRIAYQQGFGTTAAGDPVDPERTVFRAASNAKLVAATAVLQLAEEGRWRLTDDVNRYLPPAARLDATFRAPVTLAHLLTHTAGFESRAAGTVTLPSGRLTLAEFFARYRPVRVTPPGAEVSYSNIGPALAGYLVGVVTGEPFGAYAQRHVFRPLGMAHSTFDQPPPAAWARDLAGGPPRGRYDLVFTPYPAASLVTTPADMGRFLAAQLGGGAAYGGRILQPTTVAEMQATHWRAQPAAPGVAYGFFEGRERGHRMLFHTGDSGDHSLVLLLPDDGVGFYFVYSGSDAQAAVRERFARAFLDRYVGPTPDPAAAPPSPRALGGAPHVPASSLAGTYRGAQYARSNYEKLKAMFLQVRVQDAGDGTLRVLPPGGAGPPLRLRPVAPLTFRGDSGEVVAFRQDAAGHVAGFTLSGFLWDPSSWDRIGPLEDGRVHLAVLAAVLLVVVARVAIWPLVALARRRRHRRAAAAGARDDSAARAWWRWSGAASALILAAPLAAVATAYLSFQHPVVAIPRAAAVLCAVLLAAVVAGLPLVIGAAIAWQRGYWTRPRRVHVTLLALAFVVVTPVLAYWRLLGL